MSSNNVIAKVRSDIQKFGWHCLSVSPSADESGSHFTYTIGLTETFGHPELMIFGLGNKISHGILTDCVQMIRSGTAFQPDIVYPDVISGDFNVVFRRVNPEHLPEYFGAAVRYYGGKEFSGFVMFWPGKNHLFPWQETVSTAQREALNIVH